MSCAALDVIEKFLGMYPLDEDAVPIKLLLLSMANQPGVLEKFYQEFRDSYDDEDLVPYEVAQLYGKIIMSEDTLPLLDTYTTYRDIPKSTPLELQSIDNAIVGRGEVPGAAKVTINGHTIKACDMPGRDGWHRQNHAGKAYRYRHNRLF